MANGTDTGQRQKVVLAITDSFCVAFLRGQAKYLRSNGFDVFLLSPDGPELASYEEEEGCTIIRIAYSREISLLKDIASLIKTVKVFSRIKPDVVNAGTPKAGLICMLASAICGIRNRIFTLRGLRSTAMKPGLQRRIVETMEKLTHRLAKKIICISPSMANYAYEQGILDRTQTVILGRASSNGVDVERFSPQKKKHINSLAFRKRFHISEEDFVVGFVGRIVKSKGIEEIYHAFEILSSRYSNIKLLVVGPEESHSDSIDPGVLAKMKENPKVILTGKMRNVEYVYPVMQVLCLPSHNFREGFGNVAIEASASGIPIIVTRGAGCQDAVHDGVTGALISPKSVKELVVALTHYLDNPDVAAAQGESGVQFARRYFRSEIIWEAQCSLYKEMLGYGKVKSADSSL